MKWYDLLIEMKCSDERGQHAEYYLRLGLCDHLDSSKAVVFRP